MMGNTVITHSLNELAGVVVLIWFIFNKNLNATTKHEKNNQYRGKV